MKHFYDVPKRSLLMIAGIVWMIAGFNIIRLGILSYMEIDEKLYHYILSVIVFGLFGTMFFMITRKHTKRIKGYEQKYRPFWNFFDIKSYIIMAIMMGGGIYLRSSGVAPVWFIAFFYSGLGCALFLAGVIFVYDFFRKN